MWVFIGERWVAAGGVEGTAISEGWGQHAWRSEGEGDMGKGGAAWDKNKMFPMHTTSVSTKGGWMRVHGNSQ